MRTVSIGPCACCGGAGPCPALYVTLQGTQTQLYQQGSTWVAEWTFDTSSLTGTAIPAQYLNTAQFNYFVKREGTLFFPGTGWANWLCVVDGEILIATDLVINQQNSIENMLWVDAVVTFVFCCETTSFSAAEALFQSNLEANIAATMNTLTTL